MNPEQAIKTPFGVSVFGSAISRITPDRVSIVVVVSRLESKPADSFAKTRQAAQAVQESLRRAGIADVGVSRIGLSPRQNFSSFGGRLAGYEARITFHIVLRDLDRIEAVLTALVGAGVNEVKSVEFQTSRLKEVRADTRRRAVAAAREKALNYCAAAGVELGAVLHIEDVNPNVLRGYESHVTLEPQYDDLGDSGPGALDPGAVAVGAAVMVAYALQTSRPE